jgi:hypothetical protein
MIEPRADRPRPITLGADKAHDAEDFFNELRSMNATPHVAQNNCARERQGLGPYSDRLTKAEVPLLRSRAALESLKE